jgi:predicted chitinase
MFIDIATINELCAKAGYKPNPTLVAGFVKAVTESGEKFGINTPQRLACFIGQCLHESGGFTNFTEGGYLPASKREAFLKSKSYYPLYGRGPIQVTKTSGCYTTGSKLIFGDNSGVTNPEKFNDPYYGTLLSMHWWQASKVNAAADSGSTDAVSKKVNYYDNVTFDKRANLTADTVAIFKKKTYNVTFKGSTVPQKHTLWNYLTILSGYINKKK